MAHYDYQCAECGVFEVARPLGTAEAEHACPRCSKPSRRLFAACALMSGSGPLSRAREADRRSAHEPAVVRALPADPSQRRRRPSDPLHARLPRP